MDFLLTLCLNESQQCGNKTMLTVEIYNKVAENMIEFPAIDDHIVRINEGT